MKTNDIPKFQDYLCEAKKYPELDKISKTLFKEFMKRINEETKKVESGMQHKAQYVLEEINKYMQEAI